MREILEWIRTAFPALEYKTMWNQPVFVDHGTFIIGFSAAKGHFSVSPEPKGIDQFSEEIEKAGYPHTSNLFRIGWNAPVDFELLERMIQFNIDDKAACTKFWRESLTSCTEWISKGAN